jgi:formyl-CoA transferase
MRKAGITFGIVNRVEEVATDAQMFESGCIVPFAPGTSEVSHTVDSPLWLEGEPKAEPRPAPELGQHSHEILAELGYDPPAIDTLRAAGALG